MLGVSPNWERDDGRRSVTKGRQCATGVARYLWGCFRGLPSSSASLSCCPLSLPGPSPLSLSILPWLICSGAASPSRPPAVLSGIGVPLGGSCRELGSLPPRRCLPAWGGPKTERASRHSQRARADIKGSGGTGRSGWAEIETKSSCAGSVAVTGDGAASVSAGALTQRSSSSCSPSLLSASF